MAQEESTNETLMSGGTATDDYGKVEGAGKDRVYITKEGDTLDDVAAFFYGDLPPQYTGCPTPSVVGSWITPRPCAVTFV